MIGLRSWLGETKPWPLTIFSLEKELSPWEISGQAQGRVHELQEDSGHN